MDMQVRSRSHRRRIGKFKPVDVPYVEYRALVTLYDALDGNNWTDNSNWLVDSTINNWFGVTVAGGHVTQIDLNTNNLTGDIANVDWANLTSLITLYLNSTSVSGDIANVDWANLTSLVYLRLYDTSVSGDISNLSGLTSLIYLYFDSTSVSGDISNLSGLTSLIILRLHNTSVSGDISNLSGLTSLTHLYFDSTSVSAGTIGTLTAIRICRLHNCGWNQAGVDALLLDMYTERANFTHATPALNIGADNSVPSGVYQDGDPPTTGLEYVYELANDPEVEGFNTWTITYNGGIAP